MQKKWELFPTISDDFKNQFPEINPVILQLLYNRGLDTQEKIDQFLLPDYSQDIYNPLIFLDIEKAVERIYQAIEKDEKIAIFGDYDSDGITATAILFFALNKIGAKDILTYIPNRGENGYGLNKEAVTNLADKGVKLIVTCDCGITGIEEVELAKQLGIDVIITDHHCEPEQLPSAFAIINPQLSREKYPFRFLAGVGVAFKLIQALFLNQKCQIKNKEAVEKWLLDLVAVGTVADLMPLLGENRVLVKYGLIVLNKTSNIGLRALIEKSSLSLGDIDTTSITYQISPRLNAAARITHADEALDLILSQDVTKAEKLADNLNLINKKRQQEVDRIFQEIQKSVPSDFSDKVLVIFGADWPKSVLGLCANRLVEQYYCPVILFSRKNNEVTGSGRSIPEFDLYQSLNKLKKYFTRFGGHAGAAGLTLKDFGDFEKFKKDLLTIAEQKLKGKILGPSVKIDAEVFLDDINWSFYDELKKFEPLGKNNWASNFLAKNIHLNDLQTLGNNGQHCRLLVDGGRKMIFFGTKGQVDDLKIGDSIDVIFQAGINQWNGQQELQLKVIDLKKSI
jgi:single-stranded-DNA-specific exonuclease